MMLLLCSLVFAQEPQEFKPVPADVTIDGTLYMGILIDESDYAEIGQLRTKRAELETKVQTFEEWQSSNDKLFDRSINEITNTCKVQQAELKDFYVGELKKAKRKDAIQRHALPLGVAIGVVGSTVMYAAATRFYGEVLTSEGNPR